MRISAGVSFYQCREELERCLSSLSQFDRIYCVDGRYPDFPADNELSNDGSRELVQSFKNAELIDCPADEVTKRNAYLKNDDALLIIDSDEYIIEFDRAKVESQLEQRAENIFCVNFLNLGNQTVVPRLWLRPYEMEYLEAHNIFKKKNSGEITRSTAGGPVIEGITIAGDVSLRSAEREILTTQYQEKLIAHEKGIKFKFGFRSSPN